MFNTYAGLYLPKDNDLLLSMPIPVSVLVAARLLGVYLMGLLYSAIVILPAIIVYWATAGATLPAIWGGFLMTLCAIAVLWKGSELFAVLDAIFVEMPDSVPLLLCVMLCGLASMNFMTAPSVSLEGKNLWLLHSLPVEPWKVFRAKIGMQLLLTGLPLLFGFMLLPGWVLGFYRYMSCFVGANLFLCVCIFLWLKKKGAARFSAL